MKFRPVGTHLFHAETDGLRDMTKLIVTFYSFALTYRTAAICKHNWSFNNPGLNFVIIKYIPCIEVFGYCLCAAPLHANFYS